MGSWTGKWKTSIRVKCECKCGKMGGAESWNSTFDADSLDAMKHDGETEEYIQYICEDCAKKYGSGIIEVS